jgi:hypothetical protein
MMFLVRSAFWLSLVYAHMPLGGVEIQRAAMQTKGAIVAGAAEAVEAKCTQEPSACRALAGAAAGFLLRPSLSAGAEIRNAAPPGRGRARITPPSTSSLKAADMTPPWRGHAAKSGV